MSSSKIKNWTTSNEAEERARKQLETVFEHGIESNAKFDYWDYLKEKNNWETPYADITGTQCKDNPFEGVWYYLNVSPEKPGKNHHGFCFCISLEKYQRNDFTDMTLRVVLPGVNIIMSDKTGWDLAFMQDLALNISEAIVNRIVSEMKNVCEADPNASFYDLRLPIGEKSTSSKEWLSKYSSKTRYIKGKCFMLEVYHDEDSFFVYGHCY